MSTTKQRIDVTKFAWQNHAPVHSLPMDSIDSGNVCYEIEDENEIVLMTSYLWSVASKSFRNNAMAAKLFITWNESSAGNRVAVGS